MSSSVAVRVLGFSLLAAAAVPGAAMANPPADKGRADNSHYSETDSRYRLQLAGISRAQVRQIAQERGYVGYADLPPGIRKNLQRGKPLPPGIAKQLAPAPLIARLPQYDDYEWHIAGRDLVLYSITAGVIADVLVGVFD